MGCNPCSNLCAVECQCLNVNQVASCCAPSHAWMSPVISCGCCAKENCQVGLGHTDAAATGEDCGCAGGEQAYPRVRVCPLPSPSPSAASVCAHARRSPTRRPRAAARRASTGERLTHVPRSVQCGLNICCLMTDLYPEGDKCKICDLKCPACCGKVTAADGAPSTPKPAIDMER